MPPVHNTGFPVSYCVSVDQWSLFPTGAVIKQIAFIAAYEGHCCSQFMEDNAELSYTLLTP